MMRKFNKDDFVEHWENGVGLIINIDESAVTVRFMGEEPTTIPLVKATYFNVLPPSGLLAAMYKDYGLIESLINSESTDIIRLLLTGESHSENRSMTVSRINLLLTKSKSDKRVWRKNSCLIDEKNWKKWWKTVYAKLKDDPWFDTTQSSVIKLRDQPLSELDDLINLFLVEKSLKKKLALCERILKQIGSSDEKDFPQAITDFLTEVINKDTDQGALAGLTLYIAVIAINQGFSIELSASRGFILFWTALIDGKLPIAKLLEIYSFLCQSPSQEISDHLITWLLSKQKLNETVSKFLKRKITTEKFADNKSLGYFLTKAQISAINYLKETSQYELNIKFKGLFKIARYDAPNLYASLLLSETVQNNIREALSQTISELKIASVIFSYFNKVDVPNDAQVPFLPGFLKALGSTNAERCLVDTLLTEKTMSFRKNVFLSVFKDLFTNRLDCIGGDLQRRLLTKVGKILDSSYSNEAEELRLQLAAIAQESPDKITLDMNLTDDELLPLAESRVSPSSKRLEAIQILIKRGHSDKCHSIAASLMSELSVSDFLVLEAILKSFPEPTLSKRCLLLTIQKWDHLDDQLRSAFIDYLKKTGMTHFLVELFFLDQDDQWYSTHLEFLVDIVKDDSLRTEVIKLVLDLTILNTDSFSKTLRLGSNFLARFPHQAFQQTRERYFSNLEMSRKELAKAKIEWFEREKSILAENESQIEEAIEKTKQRYEEYLKRLLPVLDELEAIKETVPAKIGPGTGDYTVAISDKISVIKEDIEGVLKILGVIDRE